MNQTTRARPRIYYGWYIVAAFMFIALVTNGARASFGNFVIPMSEEFGWDRGTISFAAALGALLAGFFQPFIGRIFDETGGRKLILAGLIGVGVVTVLLSFTFHILYLIVMFGVVASLAAGGVSINNTSALLARWFRRRRATVMGLNAGGASMGGVVVLFAMILLQATNWRLTWAVLGLIILVLAVPLAFLFIREFPAKMGLRPDGDEEPAEHAAVGAPQRGPGPLEADRWTQALRSLPFWQMSLSYMICGSTTFLLSVHFVPYAIDRGVSPNLAATIFAVMLGLNVFGAVGAGLLADRFGRKNLLALVYFLRGSGYMILLLPGLLGLTLLSGNLGLWLFALVAGFSWWATLPLTSSLTADVYGLRTLGTVTGVSFLFHQIGGAGSVWLAGVLYDSTGSYTLPFMIAGSLLFLASLSAFTIKERRYSTRYQAAPAVAAASGD
ncbi:MAG: MFS transporter [Chloroflexi bacterium]|nr:MFS transporter [Chloroflexota bacterium]